MNSSSPSVILPIQTTFYQPACTLSSNLITSPKTIKVIATKSTNENNAYHTAVTNLSTENCKKLSLKTNTIITQGPFISNSFETGLYQNMECSKNELLANNNKKFLNETFNEIKKTQPEKLISVDLNETNLFKPKPFSKQISQTSFLFVPEHRRVSTVSGSSIVSCPTELNNEKDVIDKSYITPLNNSLILNNNNKILIIENKKLLSAACSQIYGSVGINNNNCQTKNLFKDHVNSFSSISNCSKNSTCELVNLPNTATKHLTIFNNTTPISSTESIRRRSIQVAAPTPAIAFRSNNANNFNYLRLAKTKCLFERRLSQPTISINLNNIANNKYKNLSVSSINNIKKRNTASYMHTNLNISPLVQKNHTNYCLNSYENKDNHCFYNINNTTKNYFSDGINTNCKWNCYNENQDILSTKNPINNASLIKRVSWYWKSLQNVAEPLLELTRNTNRDISNNEYQSTNNNIKNFFTPAYALRSDSRTNSQYGSILQLNDESYDLEADTPPMDTMSWSNIGKKTDNF